MQATGASLREHRKGLRPGVVVFLFCSLNPSVALYAQLRPASVNVRVTDSANEEPIHQADVRIMSFGHFSATHRGYTDAGGYITFPAVERGNYYLEVGKDGYEPSRENIDVTPGLNHHFDVRLRPRISNTTGGNSTVGTVSAAALSAPSPARKEYEKGMAAFREDPTKSVPHFEKAIRTYPDFVDAHVMLGLALLRSKQVDEAMKSLTRALELDPKQRLAHTALGELLLEQRQFPRAESELLESMRLDSQAWDTAFHLARCYFNIGKYDQALEYARRSQALPQAPPTTHLLLADIYMRRNDRQNTLAELESFAQADPKSPLIPRVRQRITQLRRPQ